MGRRRKGGHQGKPENIDMIGFLERHPGDGFDVGEPELGSRPVSFFLVAGMAGQGEVRKNVLPSTGFRDDVLDLQGNIEDSAIGASARPFFDQKTPEHTTVAFT